MGRLKELCWFLSLNLVLERATQADQNVFVVSWFEIEVDLVDF